jgi:hypothetical protein
MHAKMYILVTEFEKFFELLIVSQNGGAVNITNNTGKRISGETKKLTR